MGHPHAGDSGLLDVALANIALSVLDEHFAAKWAGLGPECHPRQRPEHVESRLRRKSHVRFGVQYLAVRYTQRLAQAVAVAVASVGSTEDSYDNASPRRSTSTEHGTRQLFALPGFRVLEVTVGPDRGRRVVAEAVAAEGGCPSCGVVSSLVKDRPTCRVKDLRHGALPLRLWVRKRRFVCAEQLCSRGRSCRSAISCLRGPG